MYKYLVITNGNTKYFPSNSRDSIKHMLENNASNCWVYDSGGWWVSFAELDKKTNKPYHPKMFHDGAARTNYADMLKEFNRQAKIKK